MNSVFLIVFLEAETFKKFNNKLIFTYFIIIKKMIKSLIDKFVHI